jgi:two-component system phosphate regulon sensor histidine kinase PhoR
LVSSSLFRRTASLAALVFLVVVVAGAVAYRGLRARELGRLEQSLARQAELVLSQAGGTRLTPGASAALDALADRAGAAMGARVTLVAPDGTVVGDSAVPGERLPRVENHAGRPEIAQALAGRTGSSERRSATVGPRYLYVAVPVEGGRGGAVRLAVDLAGVDAAAGELFRELLPAAGVALVAALALAFGFARRSLQPIRELQRLTAAVAGGDLDTRVPRPMHPDSAEIARSIRRLAEQLRERLAETTQEKERLQAVLDGMAEGVLVVDPRGSIVLANGRIQEFFGARGELVGRTALEGIRHADVAELLAQAQWADEPVARVIGVSHPSARTLRVLAVRFPRGSATPMGTVAVFHDVSELAQLERMRREFVANASHELRTPLAAIRGFAETLLGSPSLGDDERRSYLEVIDRHARRLGHLVGDLLELSKIESGKIDRQLGPVDVAALAQALIRDNEARADEKQIQVSLEVKGEPIAWAQSAALEQIFTNLLDNALKYTEAGGRLDVRIEVDDAWVRVAVRDTGIGIPEADLGRIFERFYRVDRARSRALGGTGLGLAIVKHLVQSLGGEISVESEPGRGSTFSFGLPRAED